VTKKEHQTAEPDNWLLDSLDLDPIQLVLLCSNVCQKHIQDADHVKEVITAWRIWWICYKTA